MQAQIMPNTFLHFIQIMPNTFLHFIRPAWLQCVTSVSISPSIHKMDSRYLNHPIIGMIWYSSTPPKHCSNTYYWTLEHFILSITLILKQNPFDSKASLYNSSFEVTPLNSPTITIWFSISLTCIITPVLVCAQVHPILRDWKLTYGTNLSILLPSLHANKRKLYLHHVWIVNLPVENNYIVKCKLHIYHSAKT